MTDTQFQVGKVYATRGGDRVMHTEVDKDSPYPLAGYFLSGPRQRDFGNWCANGRYREDCEHPLDLLAGALPEPAAEAPADRVAELQAENARMREAILWACGAVGDFPGSGDPSKGAYFWRKELRERAGISDDELTARAALEPRT